MISLYRIDNRLIHAQVLEAWLPHVSANFLAVVNDELVQDEWRRVIMANALPEGVQAGFWGFQEAPAKAKSIDNDRGRRAIIIFSSPIDVIGYIKAGGLRPREINVGGIHYAVGQLSLGRYQTFSSEDRQALMSLCDMGIKLDARATPVDHGFDLLPVIRNA
ncbi:MAG: PTS sugar transporter subunit IIB [Elusimicrobia bacterium]|nr:PTS sugar transporter subunit IIB [Elusimicrobiota bacterium]